MNQPTAPERRALISVSDKQGLESLARSLHDHGYIILSTGSTAFTIRGWNIPVTDLCEYTGYLEMLGGRVKTLHPKIHGGILFQRNNPEHVAEAARQGFHPIDIVVVNLSPFAETVRRSSTSFEEAMEYIDINGLSLLHSAARNHKSVTVVSNPEDYGELIAEFDGYGGVTSPEFRRKLAAKAFRHTNEYDGHIASYLEESNESASAKKRSNIIDAGPIT